jgi:hypothetical protein
MIVQLSDQLIEKLNDIKEFNDDRAEDTIWFLIGFYDKHVNEELI